MPQNLVVSAGNALSLLNDVVLLKALGETLANEAQLVSQVHDITSAEALLEKLASDVNSQEIADAFNSLGLGSTYATLKTSISKLVDQSGNISPKYKALLEPLSAFKIGSDDAKVSWDISTGGRPQVQPSGYTLNLGASASLAFDAGASWPGANPPVQHLSLGANGTIDIAGSATLPYPYGTVSFNAKARTAMALGYFFNADLKKIYALAVAESLPLLANPFDFDAVFARMRDTNLDGMTYEFDGSASAQVAVSIADAAALGDGVVANLGGDISVSASLSTRYVLNLEKVTAAGGGFSIRVKLSRNPVTTTDFAASLGVDVDLTSLTQQVTAILDTAIGQWDSALSAIRPFLSPGTWLQNQAQSLLSGKVGDIIADPALKAALINDLDMAVGVQDVTDSGLATWLGSQIAGAIDRSSILVSTNLSDAADTVLGNLKAVAPALSSAAGAQLTGLVNTALQNADQALKDAVTRLLAQPSAQLEKALTDAGVVVKQAVSTLDGALKGVRDLLDLVDTKLHNILDSTENALKQKVSARLYLSESSSTGSVVEVAGTITGAGADARTVFEALTLGNLQKLVDIVDGRMTAPNFVLDQAASSITRFSKFHSDRGLEITFLGIDVKASQVVDINVTSIVDGFGNVHVNTRSELTKTFIDPFDERDVSFVDSSALVLAGAMQAANTSSVLELGLDASYSDHSLAWGDVEQFVRGLARVGLVSAGAMSSAKTAFDGWSNKAGGSGKIGGSISGSLHLTSSQIATLLNTSDRASSGSLTGARQRTIVATALAALRGTPGAINDTKFRNGTVLALGQFLGQPASMAEVDVVLDYPTKMIAVRRPPVGQVPTMGNTPAEYPVDQQEDYVYFLQQAYGLIQLVDLVATMENIYLSKAAPGTMAWTTDNYRAAQKRLIDDSGSWIKVVRPSIVGLFLTDIAPRTVAFMRTLADLAGLQGKPAATLAISYKRSSTDTETVALS